MNIQIYGHDGIPILAFPPQSSMSNTYKDFGIIDTLYSYIHEGKIQIFCIDSCDDDSWSNTWLNGESRMNNQEKYFNYVVQDVLPMMRTINHRLPYAFGVSLGATHAAIDFFRKPECFQGIIGLSPALQTNAFFGDWSNELLYQNSPLDFLAHMEKDHPFVEEYRKKQIIFCCGQGNWEHESQPSLHRLEDQLKRLDVPAWFDYWGYDVNHDWYWWNKEIAYFIEKMTPNS